MKKERKRQENGKRKNTVACLLAEFVVWYLGTLPYISTYLGSSRRYLGLCCTLVQFSVHPADQTWRLHGALQQASPVTAPGMHAGVFFFHLFASIVSR